MVSLRHASLRIKSGRATLTDLGSSNGTYVNGIRITRPTVIQPGDSIALGSIWFILSDDLSLQIQKTLTIQAKGLSKTVESGAKILAGVELVLLPGELVGIMGPSGSGKSTLISILNGYLQPTNGSVTINDCDLYEKYDLFRGRIGYVPQDDIMHADLTVSEALYYSARLRLPTDTSNDEINSRITKVIADLALQGTENNRIGNADRRGISGGQRKRVNVAMELLTDPDILFLDEPTSGLSSEDALSLMQLLRNLSNGGITVILTIHQPSLDSFRLMDALIVVGKDKSSTMPGRVAYFGPAYPDAIKFFETSSKSAVSPDAVLRGLASKPTREWVNQYKDSDYYTVFVKNRLRNNKTQIHSAIDKRRHAGGLLQYVTLVKRGIIVKLKDRWNTGVLVLQAPLIAILIGLVFGPKLKAQATVENFHEISRALGTTIFLLSISALWFGCANSAREIVGELAIYRRERMVCLSIPSYLASKLTILAILSAFQCAVLLIIVSYLGNISAPLSVLYFKLFVTSLVGVAIGLVVSVVARTADVAAGVLPLILLPMVILGGVLLPVKDLPRSPVPINAVANMMPSRWAFETLLTTEVSQRPILDLSAVPPVVMKRTNTFVFDGQSTTDMAQPFFVLTDRSQRMKTLPMLVIQFQTFALIMLVGLTLKQRDPV